MVDIWNATDKQIMEAAEYKGKKRAVAINRVDSQKAYVTLVDGDVIMVGERDLLVNRKEKKRDKKWWEYQ